MKNFFVKKNCKKWTAIFVINCFLFSFVYGNALAQVSVNAQAGRQFSQIFDNFILPYSYGKITQTYITGSSRAVIQIQDLHCHPQVQKNISNIIELVDKKVNSGINNIYLEGAFGEIDTSWLKEAVIQNSESSAALEKILQTGRLTGAEYYSASTGKHKIIKGLESRREYLDNLKRFGGILERQEEIGLILKGMEESTEELKEKYYNRKQIRIEKLFERYLKEEISARKYYALLSKHVKNLGIDLNKYENTNLYMSLMRLEKGLDYKEISAELQNYVYILKEKLPYAAYKMITDATNNFSQTDKLYGYLISLSREFNIDLEVNFPELNKFFAYVETSQKINPIEMVSEEQRLRNEINSRFSDTKAQREAVFLISFNKYIKDYLSSKITSQDHDYYRQNIEKYRMLWIKYVDNRVFSMLEEYIEESDRFYNINVDRNGFFAKELGIKEALAASSNEDNGFSLTLNEFIKNLDGKEVDIVITGGFHTEGVSRILQESGISYIVITPNVTEGVKEAEEVYYKIAKIQSKQLRNTGYGQEDGEKLLEVKAGSANTIETSALANMILSLDLAARAAFIRALNNQDISSEEIPIEAAAREKLKEIAQDVRKAELLESDDSGDITEALIRIINANLPEGSEYKNKDISIRDLLGKTDFNFSALAKAIDKDADPDPLLRIAEIDNPVLKQYASLLQKIKDLKNYFPKLWLAEPAGGKEVNENVDNSKKTAANTASKILRSITGLILTVALISSISLNLFASSSFASRESSSRGSAAVMTVDVGAENERLFESFKINNTYFRPGSAKEENYTNPAEREKYLRDSFNESLELSNSAEVQTINDIIIDVLKSRGIVFSEAFEIFVPVDTLGGQTGSAAAHNFRGLTPRIIIPKEKLPDDIKYDEITGKLMFTDVGLAGTYAHEYTHIINAQEVASGALTRLEDEMQATFIGELLQANEAGLIDTGKIGQIFTDMQDKNNNNRDKIRQEIRNVSPEIAPRAKAFMAIIDNREQVERDFNTDFKNIYYTTDIPGPLTQAEYDNLTDDEQKEFCKKTNEIYVLTLYNNRNNNSKITYAANLITGEIMEVNNIDRTIEHYLKNQESEAKKDDAVKDEVAGQVPTTESAEKSNVTDKDVAPESARPLADKAALPAKETAAGRIVLKIAGVFSAIAAFFTITRIKLMPERIIREEDLKKAKEVFGNANVKVFYMDELNKKNERNEPIEEENVSDFVSHIMTNKPVGLYPSASKRSLYLKDLPLVSSLAISTFARIATNSNLRQGLQYPMFEMLKNAFVHGNHLDAGKPIYIEYADNVLNVYNELSATAIDEEKLDLAGRFALTGDGAAERDMREAGIDYNRAEVEINGKKFTKASVSLSGPVKLELKFSANLADKLALQADGNLMQKVLRAALVGIIEFPFSILPFFVKMHYGRAGPAQEDKQSGALSARVIGNILIKAATAAGAIISIALSLSFLLAVLLPFALNVITHAVYNLSVSDRLEFGSGQTLPWDEKAKQLLSRLDNVIQSFNESRYQDDSDNPFKKAGWHKWDKIRDDFQKAADEKSFQSALNNFLWFKDEVVSNMNNLDKQDFIVKINEATGTQPISEKRLSQTLSWDEKARQLLSGLDGIIHHFNIDIYGGDSNKNNPFMKTTGWNNRMWDNIRDDFQKAADEKSFQAALNNFLGFENEVISNMDYETALEFINQTYKATGILPLNLPLSNGSGTISLTPLGTDSRMLFSRQNARSNADVFSLFEKFIDFNKIALSELGSGDEIAVANSQKALIEMINILKELGDTKISGEAEKRLANIAGAADLNGVINYVHQGGIGIIKRRGGYGNVEKFQFQTVRTDRSLEEDFGEYHYDIQVYNYSEKPLTEDMVEFLSNLRLKSLPRRGAGRTSFSLFVKDNTIIFDMHMGEHSAYSVIHLDDLNQGMYGVYNESSRRWGNTGRTAEFARAASSLGMDITRFDVLSNNIRRDGYRTSNLISVLYKYMKEAEKENPDENLLGDYIDRIQRLGSEDGYVADKVLSILSSKTLKNLKGQDIEAMLSAMKIRVHSSMHSLAEKVYTRLNGREAEGDLLGYQPLYSNENNMLEDFIRKIKAYADAAERKDPKGIESAKEELKAYIGDVNNRALQVLSQVPQGWEGNPHREQIASAVNGIVNIIEQILSPAADFAVVESYKKRLEKRYLSRQLEIIDGILKKKYNKGIESIDKIPSADISLRVPGVGGFNMAYRAGDRLSAPRYYADMLSKLILIFTESGGLDRELEGYTDDRPIDPNEGAGDFDLSDALRLGFIEQDELKPEELQSLQQRKGNYDLYGMFGSNWSSERFDGVSAINPAINSIERKFAEGSIIADRGNFIENTQYSPIETITRILADNPDIVFDQGNVISYLLDTQLSLSDFSFVEEGYIGQMTALSGVLRLKGGYLSVKAVQDPATDKIYCVYSEFAQRSGERNILTVSGLAELLRNNGFTLNENEFPTLSQKDKDYIFKRLRRDPGKFKFKLQSLGQFVYRGQKAGIAAYDEDKLDKDKIWFVSQVAPDDRSAISKAGGVVTVGGNRDSHIGVLTKESKVPSVFLPRGVMQRGKMTVPLITDVKTQSVNGFTSVILNQTSREIQEGDFVVIDGGSVYVLNEEERRRFETGGIPADSAEMGYMLEDAVETAEILLAGKNAVDSLQAFTILINAGQRIRDSGANIDRKLMRRSLDMKEKLFNSVRDYANEITVNIESMLEKEVLSDEETEELFKYNEMFSVWQNFYGMPAIAELSQKVRERINSLKKTAASAQSVADLGIDYADDIGSKAANVARLSKKFNGSKYNGFTVRVPDGFAAGYSVIKNILGDDFVKLISDLRAAVETESQNPDIAYELTTRRDGRPGKIPNLINNAGSRNKLKAMSIKELGNLVYAVRSTGVGEDSALNAFAGMGETELNIRRTEVEDAVIKVLISFFAKRSVDYMLETHKVVLPAVFIQEMVQNVAIAGQIFSSTDAGYLEIEGVQGLGEGSVSGRVEADNITFKIADDVISYRKAVRRIMKIVPSEDGGTKAAPLAGEERYKEVFDENLIAALIEMTQAIKQEFGYAVDVEFAVGEDGTISLLQTRPITTFVNEGYGVTEDKDLADLTGSAAGTAETGTQSVSLHALKNTANPGAAAVVSQKIAVRLVSSKEAASLQAEEIKLEENLIIAESIEQAAALKEQGFNSAVIDAIKRTGITLRGVVLTDASDKKIGKAKVSEDENGIIHFEVRSKNENITLEEIKASIEKTVSEGMTYDMLKSKGIAQVVAAENAETLQEVLARMRNVERDRRNRKTKEAVLYINGRKISGEFERFCSENYKNNNIGVYVIDSEQQRNNKDAIDRLSADGIRFVLLQSAVQVSESMIFERDGAMIEAQEADVNEALELMKKLQAARDNSRDATGLRITVKFNEDVLKELMGEKFDKKKYEGIMPVIEKDFFGNNAAGVKKLGKLEIDVKGAIEDKILENNDVAAIGSNNEEVFQNNVTKEQRERAKSVKEKFEQGEKAAWGNKFNDTSDIFAAEEIITALTPEDENLSGKINEFTGRANNGLSAEAQSYLKHLIPYPQEKDNKENRYIEALGFIRGAALNAVGKELEPVLRANGINVEMLKKNDNLYRALLIKGLQIKLERADDGKIRSLEDALKQNDSRWISENALTYLDRIISAVNNDITKTLSENEYKIEKLKGKDKVASAIERLNDFNLLLQEKFRVREAPKEIKVSALAVRNILSAA